MKKCVLNYEIDKNCLLGKGGFGSVYLARNELNLEYACKIISLQSNQRNYLKIKQLVERELSIMSSLDHPSIVKMSHSFYDGKHIYIFMEYCNDGDLKQKVRKLQMNTPQFQLNYKKFESLALDVFWDILDSLSYLYTRNIIHRDIKLENVLIHNGKYKLSDFGLSKILIDIDEEPMNSILGTPCYQSPQILRNQIYSPKTDIWSFGVLLYEIIQGGRLPFRGCNAALMLKDIEQKLQTKYLQQQLQFLENKLLYYLIQNMLVIEEDKRISLKELLRQVNTYRQSILTIENEKLQICETRCKPYYQKNLNQTNKPTQQNLVYKQQQDAVPFRFRIVEKTYQFEKSLVSKILDPKISCNYVLVAMMIVLYLILHNLS